MAEIGPRRGDQRDASEEQQISSQAAQHAAKGRLWRVSRLVGAIASPWDRVALAAILAGAVIRVIWGLLIYPPVDFVYSDMGGYVERAQRLAEGSGLVRYDAFFPPGTHMLLAAPMGIFGTGSAGLWAGAVLWCALSSLIPLFVWRLARLLLTQSAAALSAVFCAFWPLFITYGGYFSSETPSLALMISALWAGYRASRTSLGRRALYLGLVAGLLGGAAVAMRPQWIFNLAVLAVPLLWRFRRQALLALAGIAVGNTVILAGVVLHNSVAAGKPTGLSENSGMNFWLGHCDVHTVEAFNPQQNLHASFTNPVWSQLRRGGNYYFEGPYVWDQSFFYELGLQCIRQDGVGHVRLLARSVLDMSATTIPWPQVDHDGPRGVAEASNLAYSLLLPWIVVESVFLIRRRHVAGRSSGELVILIHLGCVVLLAIFIFGDPRLRSSYDVFGLALLAALVADRLGLDGTLDSKQNSSES